MLPRIKALTSHAGYGRFLDQCTDTAYVIPKQADIPSPYAYSPEHVVFQHEAQYVIVVETRHKRYEVFSVTQDMLQVSEDALETETTVPEAQDELESYVTWRQQSFDDYAMTKQLVEGR